jgi:hypothetical protein
MATSSILTKSASVKQEAGETLATEITHLIG